MKNYNPNVHNPENEEFLTGDVATPGGYGDQNGYAYDDISGDIGEIVEIIDDVEDGDVVLPVLLPDEYSYGNETGALKISKSGSSKRGPVTRRPGGRVTSHNRRSVGNRYRSRGVSPRTTRDVMQNAAVANKLSREGARVRGKILETDNIPIVYAENATIHAVEGIREGATILGYWMKHFLTQGIVNLPFKQILNSTTPSAGGTHKAEEGIPDANKDTTYKTPFVILQVGASALNSNSSKVMKAALQTDIGGTTTTRYTISFSYVDSSKPATFYCIIPTGVDGNYFPDLVDVVRSDTGASVRGVWFTMTGNDGSNDVVTTIIPGSDSPYMKSLFEKLLQ